MKYSLLIILAICFFSCKQNDTSSSDTEKSPKVESIEEAPKMTYTITPFAPSQEFPGAAITDMKYEKGQFKFGVGGDSYKLGVQTTDAPQKNCANSAKGQHIHLIPNNLPYAAKYTPEFDYDMPDGEHHILAFLSRSYHESIKTAAAHRAIMAVIKDKSIIDAKDIDIPMIFYSRPKGNYVGSDTEKVMLDFYLVNADMNDYQVEAQINGEKHMITKWQPYYIEGLPMGDNEIKLTLQDKTGKTVEAPYNPVTRVFKLEGDPEQH